MPDFLTLPFTSVSGTLENLVNIKPTFTLPDGKTYYAGSTSIVASDMLRLLMDETPIMVVLTIAFTIILKLLILRKI
ncbi:MAG: hypothetical protein U5K71_13000 [Gracilimonas sp.]|nr:hypothetical protein [Gracilimonas sp.]